MDGKKLSMVCELDVIRQQLLTARLLADILANHGLPDEHARTQAPRMLEATLALAAARVRLLSLVVQGAAEPKLLVGPENWAASRTSPEDIILPRRPRSTRHASPRKSSPRQRPPRRG
jgi:hypothetical protein